MLSLIFILVIGFMIFCEIKYKNHPYSDWDMSRVFTIPLFVICFIGILIFTGMLVEQRIIDDEIELYQTQNKEIEEKVKTSVEKYMAFEHDTFTDLKPESYINLVNLYPELKSDDLIQQEIALYIENNNKILELNEKKLGKTIYKWWLYFGE